MHRAAPWALVAALLVLSTIASIWWGRATQAGTPVVVFDLSQTSLPAFFACMDGRSLLIAAHRGGPIGARPENGLSTLSATLHAVPALLEIDISKTSDDVLILFHDEQLERTTNGTGPVYRPWRELRDLQLRGLNRQFTADHIPLLSEVLAWAHGRAILQLDRRGEAHWSDIAAAVQDAGMAPHVIAIAYSIEEAATIHSLLPNTMISVPINSYSDLTSLRRASIPLNQVLAWTGTSEIDERLNASLDGAGVPVIHGVFERQSDPWDLPLAVDRVARAGHDRGIDILSVNQPAGVWALLDSLDPAATSTDLYQSCLNGAP